MVCVFTACWKLLAWSVCSVFATAGKLALMNWNKAEKAYWVAAKQRTHTYTGQRDMERPPNVLHSKVPNTRVTLTCPTFIQHQLRRIQSTHTFPERSSILLVNYLKCFFFYLSLVQFTLSFSFTTILADVLSFFYLNYLSTIINFFL